MFSEFPSDAVAIGPVPGIHYVEEALEKRTRETQAARNLQLPGPKPRLHGELVP